MWAAIKGYSIAIVRVPAFLLIASYNAAEVRS